MVSSDATVRCIPLDKESLDFKWNFSTSVKLGFWWERRNQVGYGKSKT